MLPLSTHPRGEGRGWKILSADTDFIGIRMPKNNIALDLAKHLKRPITATSANLSGHPDCYSALDVTKQFIKSKDKPDIIINTGKLKRQKPSTLAKIYGNGIEILRQGPITKTQIKNAS
ncbi:MAG: Sua5/YciO/YrdC/YwlC family protein [Candidatus Doudnabacteria bacterium]|nr:Sua5/YciO/YrdC/YwlC family protein [Candidatus Doudnabacteria bacterium]